MKPFKVLLFVTGLVATLLSLSSAQGQVSFPGPELLGRPTEQSVTVNVVANAAILIAEPIADADAEKWRAVMNVNLFG